jgi:small subunit ribosomal protein S16
MVKIRLMRMGATKRPFYRVVVADSRSPRDGRFIENIGKYHPMDDPSLVEIDQDRALYWLSQGAQPTEQVRNLLRIVGVWERFEESKPTTKRKSGAKSAPAAPSAEANSATSEDEAPTTA